MAKIRNQYNQVPHLTQDTTWESENQPVSKYFHLPLYWSPTTYELQHFCTVQLYHNCFVNAVQYRITHFQLTCLDIFATYSTVRLQSLFFDIIAPCRTGQIHSLLRYCVATTPLLRHSSPCRTVQIHSLLRYCVATTPLFRHHCTMQNWSDTFLITVLCSYNPSTST